LEKAIIEYAKDGTTETQMNRGVSDTGKWLVRGDPICVSWSKWCGLKERCVKYTKLEVGKLRYDPVSDSGDGGTAWKK
jgi:hypothetical protein